MQATGASKHVDAIAITVVAPHFPSINQPWVDTYLEQLLKSGFSPSIFSFNQSPDLYHAKVERLGLLARKFSFPLVLGKFDCLKVCFEAFLKPRSVARAIKIVGRLKPDARDWFRGFCETLRFIIDENMINPAALIHSHSEFLAHHFLHLAAVRDIPLVLTFHGLPPVGIGQLADRKRAMLYRNVRSVLVNTAFAKDQVVSLGCPEEKVTILPQGLPLEDFPFVARPAPEAGQALQLLSVGRFHRDKGQGYSLLALRRLVDSGVLAHWHFVGVGPDLPRLKSWVRRLGLKSHVTFHEGLSMEGLRELYQTCHLFVLSSIASRGGHIETQGVVLQESQASGCIPIAARVGGIPECINEHVDALLFRQKSSRELADAILYILARPDEWHSYQAAGRENVEQRYAADVIGAKMASVLQAAIDSGRSKEGA